MVKVPLENVEDISGICIVETSSHAFIQQALFVP